jgi:hemoglobin
MNAENEIDDRMVFDRVGGEHFFFDLVDRFYDGVENDHVLLPLYPEGSDTVGARRRLSLFLMQYFGGPDTYNQERGHPRLRMRHVPYAIGEKERDHWLLHMASAIDGAMEMVPDESKEVVRDELIAYMLNAAEHLRNQ